MKKSQLHKKHKNPDKQKGCHSSTHKKLWQAKNRAIVLILDCLAPGDKSSWWLRPPWLHENLEKQKGSHNYVDASLYFLAIISPILAPTSAPGDTCTPTPAMPLIHIESTQFQWLSVKLLMIYLESMYNLFLFDFRAEVCYVVSGCQNSASSWRFW